MKKRKAISKIILSLVFAFLIWITCMSYGWRVGLTIWIISLGISALIIIAIYLTMEGE